MRAPFSWAELPGPGRITIRPRPPGGDQLDDAMRALAGQGATVLGSMLTDEEVTILGLTDEGAAAERQGIRFVRFPIVDHRTPTSLEDAIVFADELATAYRGGGSIVLHCFAGIGRSALMAIATLVRAGVPLEDATLALSAARGLRVPETPQQWAFVQAIEAATSKPPSSP
ncbi:MAG: tyrosine protein phosphatase [Deltaproteobacteria bacterium]|jgi:protein-tyrosine phosphatase